MKRAIQIILIIMVALSSCQIDKQDDQLSQRLNWIRYQYFTERSLDGIKLINCTLIPYSSEDKLVNLYELAGTGNKLIFRITGLQCEDCIDLVIEKLKKISKDIGHENIVIIGSFMNERDFQVFKKVKQFNFSFYSIPFDALGTYLEGIEKPYVFILDTTLTAKMLMIPDRKLPDIIDVNLQLMQKRLNDYNYDKLKHAL
jgi:SepF-like predicted cell division protein (DUF552 family)